MTPLSFRNKIAIVTASALAVSFTLPSVAVRADDASAFLSVMDDYSFSVSGESFDFSDRCHNINILNGSLKNGMDISFYGLNDDGNLAIVYFNTDANQGKGIVASNEGMTYISYANGNCSEYNRGVGTFGLFGFDLVNADSSLEGMMNVFNASLGSFLKGYGATVADYSARCCSSASASAITYVQGQPTSLLLMDDNYITNPDGAATEAFMANEWGIYSGYQVINNVDYNTFCFFGEKNDLYFYGYAPFGSGYQVMTMKGTVSRINARMQSVDLRPVNLAVASDDASQYITKMAGCLMAAQGVSGMNLDTLKLEKSFSLNHFKLSSVIRASTSTASGVLVYSDGKYIGTLKDSNGNTEELSVVLVGSDYLVNAQKTGSFTVSCKNGTGSLAGSNPANAGNEVHKFSLGGLILDWVFSWVWF